MQTRRTHRSYEQWAELVAEYYCGSFTMQGLNTDRQSLMGDPYCPITNSCSSGSSGKRLKNALINSHAIGGIIACE